MRGAIIRGFPIAVVLAAAGCATRTPYLRPAVPVPTSYPYADSSSTPSLDHWWERLRDPQLDTLIEGILANNNDLTFAALNVRAARLQARLAVINPTLSAGYSYQYTKLLASGGSFSQVHSAFASPSYEVDLWGKLAAVRDAATWEAQATEEDRASTRLSLIGTAIDLYYRLAELNQRIVLGEQSIAYAARTLQLVGVLKGAGVASRLEIAAAEQNLETQKAGQTTLFQQRTELRNALTVLLNGTLWSEASERASLPEEAPAPVTAGLPASLLGRRPDLRAAEWRLRETLAKTDAMRLSFYPAINLTGAFGTTSTEITQIVANPVGTFAAALTLPFIQVNEAKFATALARTQYEQAVVSFRKALLQALADVENALSARTELASEGMHLEASLEAARTAERLYEVRYREGAVALQFWLNAQQTRRQAETALAANRLQRLENDVALCQALGGDAIKPTTS